MNYSAFQHSDAMSAFIFGCVMSVAVICLLLFCGLLAHIIHSSKGLGAPRVEPLPPPVTRIVLGDQAGCDHNFVQHVQLGSNPLAQAFVCTRCGTRAIKFLAEDRYERLSRDLRTLANPKSPQALYNYCLRQAQEHSAQRLGPEYTIHTFKLHPKLEVIVHTDSDDRAFEFNISLG